MAAINPHPPSPGEPAGGHAAAGQNVIERLRQRIRDAKGMGVRVRSEWLDDEQASWCEIGGVVTIFIDLSQTAAEQLQQLEDSLASLAAERTTARSSPGRAA